MLDCLILWKLYRVLYKYMRLFFLSYSMVGYEINFVNLSIIFSKEGIKLEIHRYYFRSYQDTFQGSRVGKNKDAQQSFENGCVKSFSFFSIL